MGLKLGSPDPQTPSTSGFFKEVQRCNFGVDPTLIGPGLLRDPLDPPKSIRPLYGFSTVGSLEVPFRVRNIVRHPY